MRCSAKQSPCRRRAQAGHKPHRHDDESIAHRGRCLSGPDKAEAVGRAPLGVVLTPTPATKCSVKPPPDRKTPGRELKADAMDFARQPAARADIPRQEKQR